MKNRADAVWGLGILPGNAGNTVADTCGIAVRDWGILPGNAGNAVADRRGETKEAISHPPCKGGHGDRR